MDAYGWAALGFGLMIGTVVLTMGYIVIRQQRTIDKLTDKLMAKDYSEYKRHNKPFEDTKDAPKQRKPLSFYDDPSIEVEEDSVN